MAKSPEFKDAWILVCFFAFFILFFPMGLGSVAEGHGAYWREVLITPLALAFCFTLVGGLCRPAGWLSAAGLWATVHWLPEIASRNVQVYFWVAAYFTLFFSIGDRLTLSKILKVALCTGPLLVLAYFLEPNWERAGGGQALFNWLVLLLLLVLVNGLLRAIQSLKQGRDSHRLDWMEK
ncbi:hypothetical protein ABS71_01310 [bacterium SCN 62-11]|nr:hypothetical protein [Candidatus Eremiobacteraeota bacterium]ODT79093.1 MAG: hypothetical protein ABS71_01310 [bacterium SCN 62-11]